MIDPSKPASTQFDNAEQLLDELERSGDSLETFQAGVKYTRIAGELEGGARHERRGVILMKTVDGSAASPTPHRVVRVDFTELYLDGVKRDERETYIFDGRWLVERQHDTKQQIERELAPEGECIDPLSLGGAGGGGGFPVPIAQKKADVLERFTAELLPPEQGWGDGDLPASMRGCAQLRLVPRPGTDEAEDFGDIRVWYTWAGERGTERLLPRLVRTTTPPKEPGGEPGEVNTEVLLINHAVNQPLSVPDGTANGVDPFDTALPAGWPPAQVEELRNAEPGDASDR